MIESWKDIIADIRKRAAVAARQPAEGKVYHSAVAGMLNELADRMEEAEVGNAAKMRETLKWLLKDIEDEAHVNGEMANADAIRTAEIIKALEEPPRNCDWFQTEKEILERFSVYCGLASSGGIKGVTCPPTCGHEGPVDWVRCCIRWMLKQPTKKAEVPNG